MPDNKSAFETAAQEGRESIVMEFVHFLKDNKKWWLIPILLVIAGMTFLTLFAGSGAAPFIYTMF